MFNGGIENPPERHGLGGVPIALESEVDESGWDADDERSSIQELYSPWSLSDVLDLCDDSTRGWVEAHIKERQAEADRAPDEGAESEQPLGNFKIPPSMFMELQSGKWPNSCLWRLLEPGSKTKLVVEGFDESFLDGHNDSEVKGLGLDMDWHGTAQMFTGDDGAKDHQIVGDGTGCGSPGPSGTSPTGEENTSWYGSTCSRRLPCLI
jgi:hypothetical protein